jgi:hypothetical protein
LSLARNPRTFFPFPPGRKALEATLSFYGREGGFRLESVGVKKAREGSGNIASKSWNDFKSLICLNLNNAK